MRFLLGMIKDSLRKKDKSTATHFVWNKGESIKFSDHFSSHEFDCHCQYPLCVEQHISKDLVKRLEEVRKELNIPLNITSGYRCAEYQAHLRDLGFETSSGVSQHELGNAADLLPNSPNQEKMLSLEKALGLKFKAMGVARTFIHVDTRDDKERRWGYKK